MREKSNIDCLIFASIKGFTVIWNVFNTLVLKLLKDLPLKTALH